MGLRHRDWLKLRQEREQMRAGGASLSENFDAMLCPQIVAPFLEDFTAIRFAQLLSSELGGFEAPPGYEEPDPGS